MLDVLIYMIENVFTKAA